MNLEELAAWIKITNVTLARVQRPDAAFLACPFAWDCFERVVDFDAQPIVLLELVKNTDSGFTIRPRSVYDLRDTMSGHEFPSQHTAAEVAAFADAHGLPSYVADGLVIFESP